MLEITIWEIILIMGIPSAITSFTIWRLQRKITQNDKKRETDEECRDEYQLLILKSVNASISLGEATAKALRDGHANGDVSAALEYSTKVKHEQRMFIEKQGIKNLHNI